MKSGSISRILLTPKESAIIHLGRLLPTCSCDLPWATSSQCRVLPQRPNLVLLQMGFSKPVSRLTAGELLPHHFNLTGHKDLGGVFSAALSVGSPRLAVSQHLALRSPDFPPRNSKEFHSDNLTHFPDHYPSGCCRYFNVICQSKTEKVSGRNCQAEWHLLR